MSEKIVRDGVEGYDLTPLVNEFLGKMDKHPHALLIWEEPDAIRASSAAAMNYASSLKPPRDIFPAFQLFPLLH